MELESILEKWEAQIAPVLAEDWGTVDLCDRAAAEAVQRLIQEIRNASK